MTQIRPNVYLVTYEELGKPTAKGLYEVESLGTVGIDEADVRYVRDCIKRGQDPAFFVSSSPVLGGRFVVVSRQRAA
jgi:hypothetical protein